MDLSDLRQEYTEQGLTREQMPEEPFALFERWFSQAMEAKLLEPNAMTLSTVDGEGQPHSRTVLLKQYDRSGFVFFTNYESTKAAHIAANPRVSLLFPWIAFERQVIVRGKAKKISAVRSLKYFTSRPRGSQLGAWVSAQSSVISSRKALEMQLEKMKARFADGKIPLPSFWGGYVVEPTHIEFWQGRASRLHDRFEYALDGDKQWSLNRLSP